MNLTNVQLPGPWARPGQARRRRGCSWPARSSHRPLPRRGGVIKSVAAKKQPTTQAHADLVRFSPAARTNWHSHVVGQTLHVTSGIALIGTRDGAILQTCPGQTVTCPPGEEHWHGATPDLFMEHIAM